MFHMNATVQYMFSKENSRCFHKVSPRKPIDWLGTALSINPIDWASLKNVIHQACPTRDINILQPPIPNTLYQ